SNIPASAASASATAPWWCIWITHAATPAPKASSSIAYCACRRGASAAPGRNSGYESSWGPPDRCRPATSCPGACSPPQWPAPELLGNGLVHHLRVAFGQEADPQRRRHRAGAGGIQPQGGGAAAAVERAAGQLQRLQLVQFGEAPVA